MLFEHFIVKSMYVWGMILHDISYMSYLLISCKRATLKHHVDGNTGHKCIYITDSWYLVIFVLQELRKVNPKIAFKGEVWAILVISLFEQRLAFFSMILNYCCSQSLWFLYFAIHQIKLIFVLDYVMYYHIFCNIIIAIHMVHAVRWF